MHEAWHWRTTNESGDLNWMRLTGQPTTAIGNVITNLLCHRRFIQLNRDNLIVVLVLGDDGAFLFRDTPQTNHLNQEIRTHFNINCKPELSTDYGTFCQYLLYPDG